MQDRYGLVPEHVRANIEMDEMVERTRQRAVALDKALKQLDHRLSVIYVKEGAPASYGMKPGFFHVRRQNDPPAANTYWPIQTPEGGFREPDSGVLHELEARDMWKREDLIPKPDVPHYMKEPTRDETLAAEQRKDELKADLAAGRRVAGEGGLRKRRWARG